MTISGHLQQRRSARPAQQAFTLIELLVVLGITALLFFLMLRPLIESLRLTQRAQLQAAAQDSARKTLETVTRELSSAVYVFDSASHPFVYAGAATGPTYDHFTNFLDFDIPKKDGTTEVAHAYNAKLDLVPARHGGTSSTTSVDPTTGEPIKLSGAGNGSASINSTGLQFPLAPGGTIIRYFVGLKDPNKPYTNSSERLGTGSVDNTYILYRVQFPVSIVDKNNPGKYVLNIYDSANNPDGLLRQVKDANGNVITADKSLDDPDFFRHVSTSDIDWLSPGHTAYGSANAESDVDHNHRVDNWFKIAKPVITAPNIDLLLLPREADGTVAFDPTTQNPAVPNPGPPETYSSLPSTQDPVAGGTYPTVTTSVTFKPATLSADAAPGSTSDYGAQGTPQNGADNNGLPYVPTIYTSTSQSWGYPPNITVYEYSDQTTDTYYTTALSTADSTVQGITSSAGDLVEYYHPGMGNTVPVYDITQGVVLSVMAGNNNYVPMSVNYDTGTINFAAPAMPLPPNQNTKIGGGAKPLMRYWSVPNNSDLNMGGTAWSPAKGVIDLTQLYTDSSGVLANTGGDNTSPLPAPGKPLSDLQAANATIVPGSVRVYGPDQSPGPNLGNKVLYTPVLPGAPLSFNEYRIDYYNNTLTFFVNDANLMPTLKGDGVTAADPVQFTFDYQANLAPHDTTQQISNMNPAFPLLVKVDYQSRDLLDVNIGVRVYDPTNGQAFTVPVSNRVKVNNSNR